jgi:DNA-binding MarR family transcriptional regulator
MNFDVKDFKYIKTKNNKIINKLSYTSKYLLLHLSKLTDGLINNVVRYKTIRNLKDITSLSERTVSSSLQELESVGAIKIERDYVFGKGRGVNSYIVFERYDLANQIKQKDIFEYVLKISDLNHLQKLMFFILLRNANDLGIVQKVTFSDLAKDIGIKDNTLKSNIRILIEKGFLYNYLSGGNLPIFSGKSISRFYINIARYEFTDVIDFILSYDSFHYNTYS